MNKNVLSVNKNNIQLVVKSDYYDEIEDIYEENKN